MTVQDTSNRNDAIADGVQTVFAYSFLLLVDSHMFVFIDGVATPTGWTVDGVGNPTGGNVTFAVAPADGAQVTLIREVPYVQEIDYVEYDPFPAEVAETGLDLAVMRDQQLNERVDRSLRFDIDGTPLDGAVLPDPVPYLVIGYDADGNLTNVNVGAQEGSPVRNPRTENQDSAGFDLTDVGNLTADSAAIAGTLTADTLAATTGLQVRGEPVANTVENDAAYDPIGAAAVVQGNLDTHTGDADIHYPDAPNDGDQYAREALGWAKVSIPPGTIVSDTIPAEPQPANQAWFNSATGKEYIRYDDGVTIQWLHTGAAPVGLITGPGGEWENVRVLTPSGGETQFQAYHDGINNNGQPFQNGWQYRMTLDSCAGSVNASLRMQFADTGDNYIASGYTVGQYFLPDDVSSTPVVGSVNTNSTNIFLNYNNTAGGVAGGRTVIDLLNMGNPFVPSRADVMWYGFSGAGNNYQGGRAWGALNGQHNKVSAYTDGGAFAAANGQVILQRKYTGLPT